MQSHPGSGVQLGGYLWDWSAVKGIPGAEELALVSADEVMSAGKIICTASGKDIVCVPSSQLKQRWYLV